MKPCCSSSLVAVAARPSWPVELDTRTVTWLGSVVVVFTCSPSDEAGLGAAVFKNVFARGGETDKIWLNLAYTYNDFRFDNDATFGNNQLPGAPRHFLRAEVLYKHGNGFYIGPNVEWVPQAYYADSANTLATEAYAVWGLKAGVDDGKYSIYLEARNIANTAYIASSAIIDRATASSPLFEPGTGRAVYAGMRVKW